MLMEKDLALPCFLCTFAVKKHKEDDALP